MATATQPQRPPTLPKATVSEPAVLGQAETSVREGEPLHTGDYFALWLWVACFTLMWVMHLFQFFGISWWQPLELFR